MGIFGAGVLGRGLGLALKMEDGYFEDMGPVVKHALGLLGALPAPAAGRTSLPIRNWIGRQVGHLECDFVLGGARERAQSPGAN